MGLPHRLLLREVSGAHDDELAAHIGIGTCCTDCFRKFGRRADAFVSHLPQIDDRLDSTGTITGWLL
jgi:hypothetical protein